MASRKVQERNRELVLNEKLVQKGIELETARRRIAEMQRDNADCEQDIAACDEQIQRRAEQVLANLQTIKDLDEKLLAWRAKAAECAPRAESAAGLLVEAARRGGAAGSDRVDGAMVELGNMMTALRKLSTQLDAKLDSPLRLRADDGRDGATDLRAPTEVVVQYGRASCLFPLAPEDRFADLLEKVAHYWSLDASVCVLADGSDFVWPSQELVAPLLLVSDDKVLRVSSKRHAGAQDAVEEEKALPVHKDAASSAGRGRAIAAGSTPAGGRSRAAAVAGAAAASQPPAAAARTPGAGGAAPPPGGNAKGSAGFPTGAPSLAALDDTRPKKLRNEVNLRQYCDLLVFMLFVVSFVNVMFMRMNVEEAHSIHSTLSSVFFHSRFNSVPALDPLPEGGTQPALYHRMISFPDIKNVDQFWLWLRGPLHRGLTIGGLHSTTSVTPLACPPHFPQAVEHGQAVRCCAIVNGTVVRDAPLPELEDFFSNATSFNNPCPQRAPVCTLRPDGTADQPWLCSSAAVRQALFRFNYLHGGVHMRQLRVQDDACFVPASLDKFGRPCRPRFSSNAEAAASQPFGPGSSGFVFGAPVGGNHTSPASTTVQVPGSRSLPWGLSTTASYDAPGYDVLLPGDGDSFLAEVQQLKAAEWVDWRTRGVVVTFNLYNVNYDLFATVTALFEFSPAGQVRTAYRVKTLRVNEEWTPEDKTRVVLEGLCFALLLLSAANSLLSILQVGPLVYFGCRPRRGSGSLESGTAWNLLEVAVLVLFIAAYLLRRNYRAIAAELGLTFDQAPTQPYVDLHHVGWLYQTSVNVDAVCLLISFLKVFKYFNLNPHMSMAWKVFGVAYSSLVSYILVFLAVLCGFALAGHLLFGSQLPGYLHIDSAFSTLLRMCVGSFDYSTLEAVNGYAAPIFFVSFIVFGFFVATNMFLAILNASYAQVSKHVRERGHDWLPAPQRVSKSKPPSL